MSVSVAAEPDLPPPVLRVAPAGWRSIDFISDLHLSEDTPRTFERWASYLRATPADAVFILGDLFEAWVGDDARDTGFEAECVSVLAQAATRRTIGLMVGNRDFLVGDELLGAAGLQALADPTLLEAFGQRVLLSHGDALCLDDVEYQRFRVQVRDPVWQRDFRSQPLAQRRAVARQIRSASEARKVSGERWVDVDRRAAITLLQQAGASTLVHGHTHRPADEELGADCRRVVLSDWDLEPSTAAPRAEVLRWQRSGFTRLRPDSAAAAQVR